MVIIPANETIMCSLLCWSWHYDEGPLSPPDLSVS